ncbi:hypothetical protein M153_1280001151 [Pseudoloma neurophilia]|uniref:Uncharacterized protein n=1 Tax=Pseudoloma neurophilia TaxID=146866 RepID=A0A0R0M011_9MICR|nr:hypothetical protein M153_1280001151 [Pseudoloma neurophilia]
MSYFNILIKLSYFNILIKMSYEKFSYFNKWTKRSSIRPSEYKTVLFQ